jgi:AbrB family transcriptional regulator, transcriptional pleiotropic regulator of transition state genes
MSRRSTEARPLSDGTSRVGGVVRRVDELGRIVIPVEIRKRFGIGDRDALEISVQGDAIVLSRPHDECVFCGAEYGLGKHRGRRVCSECLAELRADVVSVTPRASR